MPQFPPSRFPPENFRSISAPQISQMYIELPNVHAYEYDLSKFPALGLKNNGEVRLEIELDVFSVLFSFCLFCLLPQVFQPTDKPSGNIQALVKRKTLSKL